MVICSCSTNLLVRWFSEPHLKTAHTRQDVAFRRYWKEALDAYNAA
jgi:hypothetical protein